MRYLIFDVETLVDWDLVYDSSRHHNEKREDCIQRFLAELAVKQGKDPPFVPARFHVPVSVAFIATDDYARYITHKVVSALDPSFVVQEFWSLVQEAQLPEPGNPPGPGYQGPWGLGINSLCTFNGCNFDMPVMEVNAHRHHVQMTDWLVMHCRFAAENPRTRYNEKAHLDLFNFLSGPAGIGGGLDYWSTLVGLPGKVCMDGGRIEEVLQEDDGLAKVNDYCMSDVLNTYGLLIHTLRAASQIDGDLPMAPHTYQMDAAIEAIVADPQWVDGGCVKRWAQAYRAGKSGPADDDEPPF